MILKHVNVIHCEQVPFLPLTRAHELLEQYTAADEVVILLDHLWEAHLATTVIKPFVDAVKEKRTWKIFLVVNSWEKANAELIQQIGVDDVLYVDFFLYRVYKEIVVRKRSSVRQIENSLVFDRHKFLFLTGKAARFNRIRLLKKFVDAGLMSQAEWSFYYFQVNKKYNPLVRAQLPELSDNEFDQFVTAWVRNPDNIDIESTLNRFGYEYNGIPYNVDLYTQTDFSVISETTFDTTDNPWITEKIWIPMLNKHPFIIAGDTNILQKLERMGFETFRDFLKVPDYDQIEDPADRLSAVVENTQHLLTSIEKDAELINQDVSWNHSKLTELYFQNNERILNFIYTHKLTEFTIDDIVSTVGRLDDRINKKEKDLAFVKFYNNVKDTTWPEANSIDDFYKLPEHIQNECINNFGLILPAQ
jgi:hypothetical protein